MKEYVSTRQRFDIGTYNEKRNKSAVKATILPKQKKKNEDNTRLDFGKVRAQTKVQF